MRDRSGRHFEREAERVRQQYKDNAEERKQGRERL